MNRTRAQILLCVGVAVLAIVGVLQFVPRDMPDARPKQDRNAEPQGTAAQRSALPTDETERGEEVRTPIAADVGPRKGPDQRGSRLDIVLQWADESAAAGIGAILRTGGEQRTAASDAEGRISFDELGAGTWELALDRCPPSDLLTPNGRLVNPLELRDGHREIVVVVPRGVDLDGVTVTERGTIVANASIVASDPAVDAHEQFVAQSDELGRFRIRSIDPSFLLGARADGYAPGPRVRPPIAAERDRDIRLVLREQAATLEVHVIATDGSAIDGARVTLRVPAVDAAPLLGEKDTAIAPAALLATTGAGGRATIEDAPTGMLECVVAKPGFVTLAREVDVRPGASTTTIRLERSGAIQGTVLVPGGGAPVAGAEIVVVDGTLHTASDAAGAFVLDDLPAGDIRLRATHSDGTGEAIVHVAPGVVAPCTIVLAPRGIVEGRVRHEKGEPHTGWRVFVVPSEGIGDMHVAVTAPDGTFRAGGCDAPAYDVRVFDPAFPPLAAAAIVTRVVPDAGSLDIVVPQSDRPSAFVAGRIVGPEGQEAEGGVVCFDSPRSLATLTAPSPFERGFRVGPLPPGAYTAWCVSRDFPRTSIGEVTLGAGDEVDLGEIRLAIGARLIARLTRNDGRPVSSSDVAVRSPDGATTFAHVLDGATILSEPLPFGSYVLAIVGDGLAEDAFPFEVAGSAPVELAAVLRTAVR